MLLENTPGINDQADDLLDNWELRTRRWHVCTSDMAWCHLRSQHTSSRWPSDQIVSGWRCADLCCAADCACPGAPDNWRLPVEIPVSQATGREWDDGLCGGLWSRALGLGRVHGGVMPGGRGRGRAGCSEGEDRRGEEGARWRERRPSHILKGCWNNFHQVCSRRSTCPPMFPRRLSVPRGSTQRSCPP